MSQAKDIIKFLRGNISKHPEDIIDITARNFHVTKTTVHRHLAKLIKSGEVVKTGKTRDTRYYFACDLEKEIKFKINNQQVDEFQIYKDFIEKSLGDFGDNLESICHYGFTEVFNNALDHSKGTSVGVTIKLIKGKVQITVTDDGVGIFKTIYDFFNLDDIYESALQLSKGKMTTMPEHHTGEGLFFVSRIFDSLEIFANNIYFVRNNKEQDWSLKKDNSLKFGSKVIMTIDSKTNKKLVDIFKKYQEPNTLNFNKTEILIKLSSFKEEKLISRSQAKRVLRGLEDNFKIVLLDFKGVRLVGQGFVDEVFRVYSNNHPGISFKYVNANKDVDFMIKRSLYN